VSTSADEAIKWNKPSILHQQWAHKPLKDDVADLIPHGRRPRYFAAQADCDANFLTVRPPNRKHFSLLQVYTFTSYNKSVSNIQDARLKPGDQCGSWALSISVIPAPLYLYTKCSFMALYKFVFNFNFAYFQYLAYLLLFLFKQQHHLANQNRLHEHRYDVSTENEALYSCLMLQQTQRISTIKFILKN